MAWLDTGIGGAIGKQPPAPKQPNYWLGDVISGSGVAPGSAQAVAEQGRSEAGVAPTGAKAVIPVVPPPPDAGSLDSDWRVQQAKALENLGIGSLDAWMKAQREREIIQAGDPALAGMAGFGLDPQAGVFAQQNYLSGNADLARVDRAKEMAKRAIINKLAARGIIWSGDLGYLEGEANIDFGNQEYDVRQAVLKRLSDLMGQYLQQKQALKQSTLAAYQQAYADRAVNPTIPVDSGLTAPVSSAQKNMDAYLATAGGRALSAKSAALNKLYGLG